ncbi:two-component hybrid sensor and regulator [Nonlabens marinus S1-08]|uniref:histidine kinase n=2 Tax=Nonlabens TaxID=363408 RepID=W8VPQ9_9FLAO|nr:two-component hybrid sensor and regulator [Nonlabens marinus S1-08]
MNHYDLFPEIGQEWRDKHQQVLKGSYESNPAELFVRHDGTEQWIKWSVGPTYDDDGNINGMVMSSEDITETMEIKMKIDREHQLLLDASNKAKIGSWEMNYLTNELYWSDVTKMIHEVDMDYVPDVSTGIEFYKPGYNQKKITKLFTDSNATGNSYDVELQIITAKGNERWVRSVIKADMEHGKCIRQYGTFEDITERVLINLKYKQAVKRFHDGFQASGVGMLVIDPLTLKIKDSNPSISKMLDLDKSNLVKTSLENHVRKEDFPGLFQAVADLLSEQSNHLILDLNLKKSTGRYVSCSLMGTLLEDEYGNPVDLIVQILDVSEVKKKELELQSSTQQIKKQNERLLNFAHIVSHNLRSHSSNFEVLLQLYVQETLEEDKENIIKLLKASSSQLSETINHLNDVVAVNIEKIELTRMFLKENIFNVMENISSEIAKHDISVDVDIDDDFIIVASPAYMESIILNLLTNSIKYRKKDVPAHIRISAFKHKNKCRIIFEDNGIGIDMKQHGHKVFGMYKTFHGNKDARGIGLYMTKNQVEAMGGTIRVQSTKDVGTIFKITL